MSRGHFISTTARNTTCPTCRAHTLTAHDEGLPATVDATPIPATDEIAALLAGKRTYTKTRGGQLIHRQAGRIRGGWLKGDIHAEHKCTPQPEQLTFDIGAQ